MNNTLSDHRGVTRGICSIEQERLAGIAESRNVVKTSDGTETDGKTVDAESLISMTFWCYSKTFMDVLEAGFPKFLAATKNPEKDEYLLPIIADGMLKEGDRIHRFANRRSLVWRDIPGG